MSLNAIFKMRELELESDEEQKNSASEEDCDICENTEIEETFTKSYLITEKAVAPNEKYILQIAGTFETNPNLAIALSDNTCEVYNLSNNQFAKLTVLSEHTDVISAVQFSNENSNLIYTGSNDGTMKLWDLRTPKTSIVQFQDTSVANNKVKQLTCFDISPNNILLASGTNLFESDAFILFWDVRKSSLLGGYWESHTDDITQVKFHPRDSNHLISGSTDGLINVYDLSQNKEEDALIDSLNTESSIEKIVFLEESGNDIVGCVTHTADIQFWKLEDSQPYLHLNRNEISKGIRRKYAEYIYVVDVHPGISNSLVLAGSNYHEGECFRGLSVVGKDVTPTVAFPNNKQRVRASWLNQHEYLLLSGGEKGILSVWKISC